MRDLAGDGTRNGLSAPTRNRQQTKKPLDRKTRIQVAQDPETLGSFRPRYEIGMEDRNPARPKVDRMASKKTVTLHNVASLGPERLAAILVDLAEADAEVKRRLRLELAAQVGGDSIAAEIGKRITALRKARSFVDWQNRRDFVKALDLQRTMIVDRVAQTHTDLALDLMWRFMELAEPVINRVDDSNGSVGDVFQSACEDLGAIAAKARPDPVGLADQVFTALSANDYGVFDGLVTAMIPALGDTGTAHLKNRLAQALADRPRKAGGDLHASVVRSALQDIADGQTDVDAY